MEMDTRSDLSSPLPHVHPIFPPLSLPASGPADVTVLFPYTSPPPTLFQGQTPLHHYAGMDNSDGGLRVRGEAGGVRGGRGRDDRQKGE